MFYIFLDKVISLLVNTYTDIYNYISIHTIYIISKMEREKIIFLKSL